MNQNGYLRKIAFDLVLIILVTVQLACGLGGSEQAASPEQPEKVEEQAPVSKTAEEQAPAGESAEQGKPTEAPISTAVPATAVPQPDSLVLVAQGFGQDGQSLGFGFIVENPNPDLALEFSDYQVAAYDANGTVVDTSSGFIEVILPGQKVGVAGSMYLNEGVTVAKVEVQVATGDVFDAETAKALTTEKAVYQHGEYMSKVLGVISNPYPTNLTNLIISAIPYNAAGEIIGGGSTYLNFILAESTVGIEVMLYSQGEVDRVELYPVLSGLSSLAEESPPPAGAQGIALLKQGFGQEDTQVGFAAILQNPNSDYAIMGSMYHVTFYAADGNVVAVDLGYLPALLPNQTVGLAGTNYLVEGDVVDRIDVQLLVGTYEVSDITSTFTAENITYHGGGYYPKVTGEILNPFDRDMENLRVSVVAYNEAGEIIGGGYTYLEFVPAKGKAAFETMLTCAGEPATVEVYATLSSSDDY